jgi:hypothetical protein
MYRMKYNVLGHQKEADDDIADAGEEKQIATESAITEAPVFQNGRIATVAETARHSSLMEFVRHRAATGGPYILPPFAETIAATTDATSGSNLTLGTRGLRRR